MPTIDVDLADLNRLLGESRSFRDLEKPLRNLGMEIEGTSTTEIKLEVHHNRPDLLGTEGIARSLKGYLGIETGLPDYDLKDPNVTFEVDESTQHIRPVAYMGVMENVDMDDRSLKSIMDLQEKLHEILGREREKISIGAYDIEGMEPPFHYTTTAPEDEGFVPLEFEEKLTPQEILEKHPKGQKYRHLLEGFDRYPLLVDSKGEVLSMPPIINSEGRKVTSDASILGLDVTGTDEEVARQALTIIMTAAAERGWDIRAARVSYPEKEIVTPQLKNREMSFDPEDANRKLGLDLGVVETSEIMEKMRYGVLEKGDNEIKVEAPSYRFDLMHEVDLFEDIGIGYGYDSLEPTLPSIEVAGRPNPLEEVSQMARRVMTGFGFMEAMPYLLTSPELNFKMMRADGEAATIKNPVSEEYSILRTWLLPGLMNVLKENKRHELPQKVFEVGDVVLLDEEVETGGRNVRRAAAVAIGEELDFTYIRSIAESLLRELGIEWKIEPFEHPSFLEGRTAKFLVDEEIWGFVGEIHPEVILNFELEHPVAAFEVNLPEQ